MPEKISVKGIDKAELIAALYNNAKPQGLGFIHYINKDMTYDEACEILKTGQKYFDYLLGRVIKTDISKDELSPRLYDRDNGDGAMERIVKKCRQSASKKENPETDTK